MHVVGDGREAFIVCIRKGEKIGKVCEYFHMRKLFTKRLEIEIYE